MDISISYSRVSTVLKQQLKALVEHQEQWQEIIEREGDVLAECGVFYKKNGEKQYKKGMYVDEGISGKDYIHREAFKQMVKDGLDRKFTKIYVEDTSRFARCTEDGIKIIKDLRMKGVNVYFRKENLNSINPENDLLLTVLFASAERENQMRSERFKWKLGRLHKKGGWSGPAPYGYKFKWDKKDNDKADKSTLIKKEDEDIGMLEINDKEEAILDYIFYLYTEKLLGKEGIAFQLNNQDIKTRKGKKWNSTTVSRILNNPICIGDVVNHKTESIDITRGYVKEIPEEEQIVVHKEELRIISDEVWDKKNKIKNERRKNLLEEKIGYSNKNIFSSLIFCKQCGARFYRKKRKKVKGKNGIKIDRGYEWLCLNYDRHGNKICKGIYSLPEDELLEFIKKELKKKQKQDDSYILNLYIEKKNLEKKKIDIQYLRKRTEDINLQIIEIRQEKNKKLLDEEMYLEQLKLLTSELREIKILENKYNNINTDIERMELKYNEYQEKLDNLDFNNLTNATLKKIFNRINIMAETVDGYKNIYIHFSYNFLDETQNELFREEIEGESSTTEYYHHFKSEKLRFNKT